MQKETVFTLNLIYLVLYTIRYARLRTRTRYHQTSAIKQPTKQRVACCCKQEKSQANGRTTYTYS